MVGKLDFAINEIVKQINNTTPMKGLIRDNKIAGINKIISLDLRLKSAKIIKFMQAKVIASLPIHDVQILRVGKRITSPDKKLIFLSVFFVKFFIFEAKANEPIIPTKENRNVIEKIFRSKYVLINFVITKIKSVPTYDRVVVSKA